MNASWVLKFADPRPYCLLADVLGELSVGIGVDLRPPTVIADSECRWYFMPYLEPEETGVHDVDSFMFAMGSLTAVAFCLRMVDLHLENLLVFQGKPIIVDPECILYHFDTNGTRDRLLSTGLLSHNPGLSALRGGDLSKQPIIQIGLWEGSDGVLDYRKPATPFHNRLRAANGDLADPSEHRQSLLDGFTVAFQWFLRSVDLVSDIVLLHVVDNFRIRLYITAIHIAQSPGVMPLSGLEKQCIRPVSAGWAFPRSFN